MRAEEQIFNIEKIIIYCASPKSTSQKVENLLVKDKLQP